MVYWYLLAAGVFGGFLSGLFGVGGGLVFILVLPPALSQLGVLPEAIAQYTIANSLFATFLASSTANITHIKLGAFHFKQVLFTGLVSVGVTVAMLQFVVNTPWYSYALFNYIILIFLAYMLFRLVFLPKQAGDPLPMLPNKKRLGMGIWAGSSAGAIAPMSGLGGGIVMIPVMNIFYGLDPKAARSISLGVISITSLTGTVFNMATTPLLPIDYYNVGYIIFPVVGALGVGVLATSPLGVLASRKIPARWLNIGFIAWLLVVIIKKTWVLINL